MAQQPQVTAAEIARLAGVGRAAVSNWRRRHADFPRPSGGTETSPTFRLADIERWLASQGKLAGASGDRSLELLWQRMEAARGERRVIELLAAGGRELRSPGSGGLDGELAAGLAELVAGTEPGELFERLIDRLLRAKWRELSHTPGELAELMTGLAGPVGPTVFDPACGTGSLLRAAAAAGATSLRGQEVDAALAALAQARLAFGPGDATVHSGDSLRADGFGDLAADTVLCNPPWGVRHWGFEDLGYDSRWEYGSPPKLESELAWVQHCLAHLRPGGTAVLALPGGVNFRSSGRRIRAELLRRGALRAVLALPGGAVPNTGIPLFLWLLRKPEPQDSGDRVLFVDVTGYRAGRGVDWPAATAELIEQWRRSTAGEQLGDTAAAVGVIDLLDDAVDLTPARHVRGAGPEIDAGELAAARNDLLARLERLGALLPEVAPGEDAAPTITIGELAHAGALTVRQHTGRMEVAADGGAGGVPVLRGRDVAAGQPPGGWLAEELSPHHIRLRAGDVVVPVVARRAVARVIGAAEQGAVLGSHLSLLRPADDQLDPEFLAGHLRGERALRFAGSLSGGYRVDVRRVELPVLPAQQQRELGEVFRRLAEFERALAETAERGGSLARQISEGLAAGAIRPQPVTRKPRSKAHRAGRQQS